MRLPFLARHRRKIAIVAAIVIAIILAWTGWHIHGKRGYRAAAGIYLANGGQDLVVLEAEGAGNLAWPLYPLLASHTEIDPAGSRREATFTRGRIRLTQSHESPSGCDVDFWDEYALELQLAQGKTQTGDWDLCAGHYASRHTAGAFFRTLWDALVATFWGKWSAALDWVKTRIEAHRKWGTLASATHPRSAPPLRSFLHRLDDERLIDYMKARRNGKSLEACLDILRPLVADHPDDPWLELHMVELEADADRLADARTRFARWQTAHAPHADPLLLDTARKAHKAVARAEWRREHPDTPDYARAFPNDDAQQKHIASGKPIPEWWRTEGMVAWLRRRARIPRIAFAADPIVRPTLKPNYSPPAPAYLRLLNTIKTTRVQSALALFRGERHEALEMLLGAYRLAQDLTAEGHMISALIADGFHHKITRGLALYALNAPLNIEDLRRLETEIASLETTRDAATPEDIPKHEDTALLEHFPRHYIKPGLSWDRNPEIGFLVAKAQLHVLRAAIRVRIAQQAHGSLPLNPAAFEALFESAAPDDPFTSSSQVRFAREPDACIVYSVGPDRIDQKGAVECPEDAMKAVSGDILLRIPEKRRYPFPTTPLRAASAREVVEAFPEGLPRDPFGAHSSQSLAILDGGTTWPVHIVSYGPDLDTPGTGTVATLWSFPIPSNQPVFRPVPPGAPVHTLPPGHYAPQPAYDPTNGTCSSGDIFLAIPPR